MAKRMRCDCRPGECVSPGPEPGDGAVGWRCGDRYVLAQAPGSGREYVRVTMPIRSKSGRAAEPWLPGPEEGN